MPARVVHEMMFNESKWYVELDRLDKDNYTQRIYLDENDNYIVSKGGRIPNFAEETAKAFVEGWNLRNFEMADLLQL